MDREKWITYYLEKAKTPGFEIDTIRKELQRENVNEEDIKAVIRSVDRELQEGLLRKTASVNGRSYMWAGLSVMGLSVVIYLLSSMGYIGTGRFAVLPIGLFAVGVIIYLKGRL